MFFARRSKFHPYCAWGGEFLRLVSLWSTDNRWLGSQQPLRHVARFVALSTLAEERLPHHASACLCLECISGLRVACLLICCKLGFWLKKRRSAREETIYMAKKLVLVILSWSLLPLSLLLPGEVEFVELPTQVQCWGCWSRWFSSEDVRLLSG